MARDLSLSHEPVTDLFNRDLTAQQWDAFRLSDAQVEQYATRGYVDGVQLLNQEQIDRKSVV